MVNKERKKTFKTVSGIELKEVYNRDDVANLKDEASGHAPFTRGIYPNMYRGRVWTMRQYAGFGTAKEANQRFKFLLSQGTTGLSVAFDLPTQMGRDSDHEISKGEVGRVGVAISTLEDMHDLFDGINLSEVSVSMTINSTAPILLAMLLIVAEEQGVKWNDVRGTVQNDILKEYIARGTYIYPPAPALRLVTDLFEFCSKEVPQFYPISISGYHIREAGSTAIQEIAFTLADAICYVESALKCGLKVDDFAGRLAFFFNCHNEFFEEIAKFRAARRLWAKIMQERFFATKKESMMLRFHTQTAGSSLVAQQPENNIIRTTVQALAAVLGGTQSLHVNGYDEALSLPTENSAQIALRVQQILATESGVAEVVDPMGGSYFLESLTDILEKEAMKIISYIDDMGGMLTAIERGYPQSEIETASFKYQKEIEEKDRIIVGVNQYQVADEVSPKILKMDEAFEKDQVARVKEYKNKRDKQEVKENLFALEVAAKEVQKDNNLIYKIVTALRAKATLGEISDVFRGVFGEYR